MIVLRSSTSCVRAAGVQRMSSVRVQAAQRKAFFPSPSVGTTSLKKIPQTPKTSSAAVDKPKRKYPTLGFTKSNELFVGRLAMLGFASALIGEILTGKGALAQLGYETGLPTFEIDEIIIATIAFNLVAALLPTSGTFVADEVEAQKARPAGALQDPRISLLNPKEFFGITDFGFTKANELFVGRVAQLGFAAALIGEVVTGQGPLAQIGLETGIPIQDAEYGILALIAFFLFAAVNEGTGKFVNDEEI